ncbi:MAG: hypothetical protein ABIS67_11915 [Candidatus Eisenbacteria bacterium]
MPFIAQICMVVVTIALVISAVIFIRLMKQTKALIESANRSLAELPALISEVRQASARADELLVAFSQITHTAKAGVSSFQGIAERTSNLASHLLDEVERPVSKAVGMIRGIRLGASFLFNRWQAKAGGRSPFNQGEDHVGEQRWLDDGGVPAWSSRRSGIGTDLGSNGG